MQCIAKGYVVSILQKKCETSACQKLFQTHHFAPFFFFLFQFYTEHRHSPIVVCSFTLLFVSPDRIHKEQRSFSLFLFFFFYIVCLSFCFYRLLGLSKASGMYCNRHTTNNNKKKGQRDKENMSASAVPPLMIFCRECAYYVQLTISLPFSARRCHGNFQNSLRFPNSVRGFKHTYLIKKIIL